MWLQLICHTYPCSKVANRPLKYDFIKSWQKIQIKLSSFDKQTNVIECNADKCGILTPGELGVRIPQNMLIVNKNYFCQYQLIKDLLYCLLNLNFCFIFACLNGFAFT